MPATTLLPPKPATVEEEAKTPPANPRCAAPTTKQTLCNNLLSSCPWPAHEAFHLKAAAAQKTLTRASEPCMPITAVKKVDEKEVNRSREEVSAAGENNDNTIKLTVEEKTNEQAAGKHYTVNHKYILQGLPPPPLKASIIEPFGGQGDLLDWLVSIHHKGVVEAYDIDPHHKDVIQRDTLANPPEYKGKWVVTNPPYLARNKSKVKTYFDQYHTNDLYKCFLSQLTTGDGCAGGVVILPASFFSSPTDRTCRHAFLSWYSVLKVNYFEEQVFPTTSTTVVAFSFVRSNEVLTEQHVEWVRYPTGETRTFHFQAKYGWLVAGEMYHLPVPKEISVARHDGKAMSAGKQLTRIHLYAIDSGTEDGRICLVYDAEIQPSNDSSSRAKATIVITSRTLTAAEQVSLCNRFNQLLEQKRLETWSLFLSQFRESKQYARKRITFSLAYRIIHHLLS